MPCPRTLFVPSPLSGLYHGPRLGRATLKICQQVPPSVGVSTKRRELTTARLIPLPTGIDMEIIEVPRNVSRGTAGRNSMDLPDKPPMIFIHGSLHAAWCFRLFQHFFANAGFQTYALSLRGSGGSRTEQEYSPTLEEHLSDLSALAESLDLERPPVVVAHSIGGFIAQKWVELGPSIDLAGMVLMSSTPPSGNKDIVWRTLFRKGIRTSYRITMGFVKRTAATDLDLCREMFFSTKDSAAYTDDWESDEKLLGYMELLKTSGPIMDVKSLKKVVRGTGGLKGRVYVVGGLSDSLVDRPALEESARFWDGDLRLVENGPHDLMLFSQWEDIAAGVLRWMDQNLALEPKEDKSILLQS